MPNNANEFTGEKLAPDHLPQEQPYLGGHVLTELLGHQRVLNGDGSWTEYGSLFGVPVEKG